MKIKIFWVQKLREWLKGRVEERYKERKGVERNNEQKRICGVKTTVQKPGLKEKQTRL